MTPRKRLILACCLLLAVGTMAVIGYRVIGGPSVTLLDAVYMGVITLSRVAYGEIVDTANNHALRLFNIFVVLIGAGAAAYVFSVLTAFLVEGELRHLFRFESESAPDYSDQTVLHDTVSKILDSELFLTALRSTLPKGKEDEKFGLDYIPFMLNSIDERRKRAAKSARLFLMSMICAALIFSSVVVYFGYILVNEAAAGTGKSLADLKKVTGSISDDLRLLRPSYYGNSYFQQNIAPSLENLIAMQAGTKNKTIQADISAALD